MKLVDVESLQNAQNDASSVVGIGMDQQLRGAMTGACLAPTGSAGVICAGETVAFIGKEHNVAGCEEQAEIILVLTGCGRNP